MAREFTYRGKSLQEVQAMGTKELAEILPARARRVFKRGFTPEQKKVLDAIKTKKQVRTHSRDLLILPSMVGLTINIHNGRTFEPLQIQPEMIGHKLGEFIQTTLFAVKHAGPGVGATKGSRAQAVK